MPHTIVARVAMVSGCVHHMRQLRAKRKHPGSARIRLHCMSTLSLAPMQSACLASGSQRAAPKFFSRCYRAIRAQLFARSVLQPGIELLAIVSANSTRCQTGVWPSHRWAITSPCVYACHALIRHSSCEPVTNECIDEAGGHERLNTLDRERYWCWTI